MKPWTYCPLLCSLVINWMMEWSYFAGFWSHQPQWCLNDRNTHRHFLCVWYQFFSCWHTFFFLVFQTTVKTNKRMKRFETIWRGRCIHVLYIQMIGGSYWNLSFHFLCHINCRLNISPRLSLLTFSSSPFRSSTCSHLISVIITLVYLLCMSICCLHIWCLRLFICVGSIKRLFERCVLPQRLTIHQAAY